MIRATRHEHVNPLLGGEVASQQHNKRNTKNTEQQVNPLVASELAAALNKISFAERQQVSEDIHGVTDALTSNKEDPIFIEQCLDLLEKELQKMSNNENVAMKAAYDLAVRMDHQFVYNREFRLMFLRAEEFVIEKVATRILTHFKYKLDLFGERLLVKDIRFDDLNADDRASLCCGSHQFLGATDVQGRTIAFFFPELVETVTWENFARARWYQYMVALEEESTQKHGAIFVVLSNGHLNTKLPRNFFKNALKVVFDALPVRRVAIHLCFIDHRMPFHLGTVLKFFGERSMLRIRIHLEENVMPCLYTLQSFGIPPSIVPWDTYGGIKKEKFLDLLEERKKLERRSIPNNDRQKRIEITIYKGNNDTSKALSSTLSAIGSTLKITPNKQDILLGRGVKYPGNFILQNLLQKEINAGYESKIRFEKTVTVLKIVRYIQESGGRFMKLDTKNKEWVVANDEIACDSISARLRTKVRRIKNSTGSASNRNCCQRGI